jgi:hypothetical protein
MWKIKLKRAVWPVPLLRDGKGFNAPMKELSALHPTMFAHLPPSHVADKNLEYVFVEDAQPQEQLQQHHTAQPAVKKRR